MMFTLMIPALMGFLTLSIEGGRYLRLKSAMADAAEVTALALSAREGKTVEENEAFARLYLETLVPEAENIQVSVQRLECSQIADCIPGSVDETEFVEYTLKVSTEHKSLFPVIGDRELGFKEKVTLNNTVTSRKYQGNSGAVDVFFVADFSGSMNSSWSWAEGGQQQRRIKIDMLKNVLEDVAQKVEQYTEKQDQKNTMALVPFSTFTADSYVNKNGVFRRRLVRQAVSTDHEKTKEQLFITKLPYKKEKIRDGRYYNVFPTSSAKTLTDALKGMGPGGFTASYEGIIRAAQFAMTTGNERRLIIVLSDGKDYGSEELTNKDDSTIWFDLYHARLISSGYCDLIRDALNSQSIKVPERGEVPVQSRIVVIGFDYDVKQNRNLANCAGDENVYSARNVEDLYSLLVGLIAEEIGRLHNKAI